MPKNRSKYNPITEWTNAQIEFFETINSLDDLLDSIAERSPASLRDSRQRWRTLADALGNPHSSKMNAWKERYFRAREEANAIANEAEREARNATVTDEFKKELAAIMGTPEKSQAALNFAMRQIQARPHPSDIIHRSILTSLISAYEGLMGAMYKVLLKGNPHLYITSGNGFSLAEIIQLGSVDAVIEEAIAKKVNTALRGGIEDWSTVLSKSNIDLKECCIDWNQTLEIFQRRNAHVHTRGRVNPTYKEKVASDLDIEAPLDIDFTYLKSAMPQILTLGCLIAVRTWLAIKHKDTAVTGGVPYMYYEELLQRGHWQAVEKIAGVVMNIDAPLDFKFAQRIYYWVARKIGRGVKSISKDVNQWDTSALMPIFGFERLVLLGELDEAERMLRMARQEGEAWTNPLGTPVLMFDKEAAERFAPITQRNSETST